MKTTLWLLPLTVSILFRPVCADEFPMENGKLGDVDFLQHIAEGFTLIAQIDPTERITGWHQVHPAILEKLPLEMTEKFSFIPLEQRRHEPLNNPPLTPSELILMSHQPLAQGDQVGRYALGGIYDIVDGVWFVKEYVVSEFFEEEWIQELLEDTGIEIPEPVRYEINDADRKAYAENYPVPESELKKLNLISGSSGSALLGMPMPPVQGMGRETYAPEAPNAPTKVPTVSPGNRGSTGDWAWPLALAALVGFALGYGVKWMKWKQS